MNILVLIISSNTIPIYESDKEVWRLYMNKLINIDAYFIEYKQEIEEIVLDLKINTLFLPGEESFPNIIHKTLNSFDYFMQNSTKKYDFIVRTNLSTVCNFYNLEKYLSNLPTKEYIYCGPYGPYYNLETFKLWFNFVGGIGIIMSRDVCELLLEPTNRKIAEDFKNMDDIDIGYVMHTLNIPLLGIEYCKVNSIVELHNSLPIINDKTHIFYIVKSSSENREEEPECMRNIISIIYSDLFTKN